jgi:hypothetical protein
LSFLFQVLEENIRKVKLSTPDYREMGEEEAIKDFKRRRGEFRRGYGQMADFKYIRGAHLCRCCCLTENYKEVYQSVDREEGPSIKIVDSQQFIVTNIRGYLSLKVVHYVMNLHTLKRTFYISRYVPSGQKSCLKRSMLLARSPLSHVAWNSHGQSTYNLVGKIGGDSGLTPAGVEYARRLGKFAKEHIATKTVLDENGEDKQVNVPSRLWTSTLRRTKETSQYIEHDILDVSYDNGDLIDWVQFRPVVRKPGVEAVVSPPMDHI